jgi:hypothetical protein
MKYCKFCGDPLIEGAEHMCSVAESASPPAEAIPGTEPAPATESAPATSLQVSTIKQFLRNPFSALRLQAGPLFNLGLIGIVAHILAYFAWGWALYKEMVDGLAPFLGFFAEDLDLGADDDFLFRFLLISLVTAVGLLASHFVLGGLFGTKQDFRKSVAVLGTTQFIIAAGYLLAAIVCFMSIRFSVALIFLVSMVNYIVLSHTSFQYFAVKDEKKVYYVVSVFAAYLGLLWLFLKVME